MKKFIALIGCVALAGVAYAATEKVEFYGGAFPVWFNKGMYLGPLVPSPQNDTIHKMTRSLSGVITFDFAAQSILCEDSTAIVVIGAQVNDPCFVGIPTTLATTTTGRDHTFSCYVSAVDVVKVRACPAGTSDNPPSATFKIRVLSNI